MPSAGRTLAAVGARGIKRRKPKRELRDFTDDLTPGDEQRLFGRFRWGAYTPAGNLERFGFLTRQLARGGNDHAGRDSFRLLWLSLPIIAGVLLVMALVVFVVQHL
jgi:hypothetical protein